jgi:hypothetical protein
MLRSPGEAASYREPSPRQAVQSGGFCEATFGATPRAGVRLLPMTAKSMRLGLALSSR